MYITVSNNPGNIPAIKSLPIDVWVIAPTMIKAILGGIKLARRLPPQTAPRVSPSSYSYFRSSGKDIEQNGRYYLQKNNVPVQKVQGEKLSLLGKF